MSQYYDEDWERKKTYLIRSLFSDIPYRGLSPVPEEGTLTSSEEYQESSESSALIPSEELSSDTVLSSVRAESIAVPFSAVDRREPSPLPPLIIEREPNRHDEPKEYYEELLIKIRRIYRKMFIENKDLSDYDFYSDFEHNIVTSDTNGNSEEATNSTEGYNADYESITDDEYDVGNDDGEGQMATRNEDRQPASCERDVDVDVDCNNDEIEDGAYLSDDGTDYMQVTTQAIVHMDGRARAALAPSPVYGELQVEVNLHRNTNSSPLHASPNAAFHSYNPKINPITGDRILVSGLFHEELSGFVRNAPEDLQLAISPVGRESAKSPILTCSRHEQRSQYVQLGRQDYEERHQRSEDANTSTPVQCQRITEAALQLYASEECSLVGEEDDQLLEEEEDPESVSSPLTSEPQRNSSSEHIEVMRTPLPQASIRSVTVDNTRLNSDTDITSAHDTPVTKDISNVTSKSQHCQRNVPRVSFDLNVLTSIVNENVADKCAGESSQVNKSSRSRKRTNAEIEIERVNWNDLRDNFFVGVPKIFKLCSCQNHICVE